MKLHLSDKLALPLEAVTQTFAILAMRGAGKTYTASVFAEELSEAHMPFVVLDPTGAWWNGKDYGYPVTILGGDHGDIPLEESAGKIIADLVASQAPSLILDMSRLSKRAMRRFVADFAEQLYEKNRTPLHLVVDEADAFAPQKPRPDDMRMLGALDEIVRRGRIRGLGCTLVTQRSAVLNKDVLSQTEVLIALRTAHPNDRKPVLEWMTVHATAEQMIEVEASLAKLPKGDAWVMSAGWLDLFRRVHIRERRTFNSSATPEPGRARRTPRRLASVDLAALQERMAETIKRAADNDPAALRRRIVELEKILAQANAAAGRIEGKIDRVVEKRVPALGARDLKRLEDAARRFSLEAHHNVVAEIKSAIADLDRAVQRTTSAVHAGLEVAAKLRAGIRQPLSVDKSTPDRGFTKIPERQAPSGTAAFSTEKEDMPGDGPGTYAGGLLRTLAEREPMELTVGQLAALAGRSARSSSFIAAVGDLRRRHLVTLRGTHVLLTDAGRHAAGPVESPHATSPEELRKAWLRVLPAYEGSLMRALFDGDDGLTIPELALRAGKSAASSSFLAAIGTLRRNGLIEKVQSERSDGPHMWRPVSSLTSTGAGMEASR